jgi:hypothetical protein
MASGANIMNINDLNFKLAIRNGTHQRFFAYRAEIICARNGIKTNSTGFVHAPQ